MVTFTFGYAGKRFAVPVGQGDSEDLQRSLNPFILRALGLSVAK
jgi:hypothetical protein